MVYSNKNKKIFIASLVSLILLLTSMSVFGSTSNSSTTFNSPAAYINAVGPVSRDIASANDLYASVMIAQSILESNWGKSSLTTEANNYFGIKGSYNGAYVEKKTTEYDKNGNSYVTTAKFRKYPSMKESFQDNANLLKTYKSGNSYFYSGAWKSNTSSYRDATAFLTGRYATDPQYGSKLNKLISDYNLTQYDTPASTSTAKVEKTDKKFTTKENLNMRSSYNTTSSLIRTIPKDTTIKATKVTSDGESVKGNKTWYYIENYANESGWVSAYYLTEYVEPKPPAVEEKTVNKKFKTTENLRIRTSYTTESNNLGTLSKGTTVTASKMVTAGESINGNKTWYYVDKRGWVSAYYLKEVVESKPAAVKEKTTSKKFKTTGNLNIRKSYTAKSNKVGSFSKGTTVTASKYVNQGQSVNGNKTWYYVNKKGWVSAAYLKEVKTSVKKTGVTKANLNVRKSATTNSKVLRVLKKGTKITITATNKNGKNIKGNKTWYQVNSKGWVSAYYIK